MILVLGVAGPSEDSFLSGSPTNVGVSLNGGTPNLHPKMIMI